MTYPEVTTERELAALPLRAIVLDFEDVPCRIAKKQTDAWRPDLTYNLWDGGGGFLWRDEAICLPALVIWLPEVTA